MIETIENKRWHPVLIGNKCEGAAGFDISAGRIGKAPRGACQHRAKERAHERFFDFDAPLCCAPERLARYAIIRRAQRDRVNVKRATRAAMVTRARRKGC
jgi:hypothetical protein